MPTSRSKLGSVSARDEAFRAYIQDCTDTYGLGDESFFPWQNNILASDTVVFGGGRFGRKGASAPTDLVQEDLALCTRVRDALSELAANKLVGMRSEADDPWFAFISLARSGEKRRFPGRDWVRGRFFGDTICPLDVVTVETLKPGCKFWSDAVENAPEGGLSEDDWETIHGMLSSKGLARPAGIYVGMYEYGPSPLGYRGSVLLRVACGQTANGSIVGLMGRVTWT
ncbi:MAG: hypothetical protein AB7K71_07140 [Polyangiaceae bacterium]